MVPPLRRVTFEERKSNQNALPHHSVPRLGSACPHSGIAPWARREGPSMAQRGYPGIHAGMPTAQCLRSASVVNGASQIKIKIKIKIRARRPGSRPYSRRGTPTSMWERACSRKRRHIEMPMLADPPLSRAGSLPQGDFCCAGKIIMTTSSCGSELARDGGRQPARVVGAVGRPF